MRGRGIRLFLPTMAVAICALGTGCASKPAASEADARIPWDQKRVTALAAELDSAVSAVRQTALNEPSLRGPLSGQNAKAAQHYLEGLRQLEQAVGQLSRELEAGKGYEQTLGTARRIGMLLRDIQVQSRRLMVSDAQWQVIDPAIDIINKLSPYYSSQSPLLPATRR